MDYLKLLLITAVIDRAELSEDHKKMLCSHCKCISGKDQSVTTEQVHT